MSNKKNKINSISWKLLPLLTRKTSLLSVVLLACLLVGLFFNLSASYPRPIGWVNDFSGKLDQQTNRSLLSIITELKEKTGFEIAVAIVPDLQGQEINQYANELYSSWQIGSQNDEGVLILIAVADRWVRIETGYGAEGFIPDGLAGEIRDRYLVPFLSRNDYNQAVLSGVVIIADLVAREKGVTLTGTAQFSNVRDENGDSAVGAVVFFLFFVFLMIVTKGRILPWLLIFGLSGRGSYRGGSFGGGYSRGGGFGGFGGFGGGSSGGGGASGRF